MPNHSVVDPSTEEVLVTLDLAPAEEVDRVVARAREAFPGWSAIKLTTLYPAERRLRSSKTSTANRYDGRRQ
jgi:acyl-CoA reductase-like NAD-dependent aldehyde dehydrogenase